MKPQNLHAHEDRLLDLAYGELPPQEARSLESHVEGCARCSETLAGIRGVRTTMAQLPPEPAPDAGLESLLAYAQQAARNAAAGPMPQPTWWRRWLRPAMGVAAVTVIGVVSVQVNKEVDVAAEATAPSVAKRAVDSAPASPALPESKAPLAAAPPAQAFAPAAEPLTPDSAPPAEQYAQEEQDGSRQVKESVAQKPSVPGRKGSRSDWSNVGTGAGFGDSKDAMPEAGEERTRLSESSRKKTGSYEPDRRDAMTQAGAFPKPKPILAGPAPEESAKMDAARSEQQLMSPEPAMDDEAAEGALLAEREAPMQQQAPAQSSLRLGGVKGRGADTGSTGEPPGLSSGDFDDQLGGKAPAGKRKQRASSATPAAPPPPPMVAAAPMPPSKNSMESPSSAPESAPRSAPAPEKKRAPAPAELSKKADAAMRSGNRVLEVQLLRQALAAGATGKERLGLLNRLCDAEFAIGRRQAALEACALVLEEDPRSSAAQVARSRLRREGLDANDSKAGAGSRGPAKAAPVDKREAPASRSQ